MYGSTSIWQDVKNEFNKPDTIVKLIFINVAVWVVMHLVHFIIFRGFNDPELAAVWNSIFTIPADLGKLISRPWTIITHMFAHGGLFHILFNMLWLYWIGRILREFLGDSKILPLYVYGALTGAFFYILLYNILPGFSGEVGRAEALGASAAVTAVIVATGTLLPDYSIHLLFLGAVRLKWIVLFMVIINIVAINGLNAGGAIAHLGGALFGFIFIQQLRNGHDWSKGFNRVIYGLQDMFGSKKGPRVSYKSTRRTRTESRSSARAAKKAEPADKQERIDAILDKIAKSGYESLSKEEKEFLFRVSKDE